MPNDCPSNSDRNNSPKDTELVRPSRPVVALITIALGAWLFMLSGGIANIALPHLAEEFDVPKADIVWVSVGFQFAAVALTIPLARLAEILGVRRVYVFGLIVYLIGAIACSLSNDFMQLTMARVLQGLGAAGISSVNAALLRRIVPPPMLGRVIAFFSIVIGAAQGAAPIVGSTILEYAHWRWLFLYDLPLGAVTIVMAFKAIPKDVPKRERFDFLSAALCIPALGCTALAVERVAKNPSGISGLALLAFGLVSLFILVKRQKGRTRPLFPIDLFVLPSFAFPAVTSVAIYAAQGVALVALPFLLVDSLDMSLIEAGVLISVLPLATLLTSPAAGFVCDRFPTFPFNAVGSFLVAVGLGSAMYVAPWHDKFLLTVAMAVVGVGFAFFQTDNAKNMILGAPVNRTGAAGGVQSTVRVLGQMLGPAFVGVSFQVSPENGIFAGLWIGILLGLLGFVLGMIHSLGHYRYLDR